jgi:hypothetical protein
MVMSPILNSIELHVLRPQAALLLASLGSLLLALLIGAGGA